MRVYSNFQLKTYWIFAVKLYLISNGRGKFVWSVYSYICIGRFSLFWFSELQWLQCVMYIWSRAQNDIPKQWHIHATAAYQFKLFKNRNSRSKIKEFFRWQSTVFRVNRKFAYIQLITHVLLLWLVSHIHGETRILKSKFSNKFK